MVQEKDQNKESNFLFNLSLLYLFIFYSQIGGRIPILGTLRIELLVGSFLLIAIITKAVSKQIIIENNRLNRYTLLYFTILLISIPFAFVRGYALDMFIRSLKLFSIYLMIVATVTNEQKLRKFIWCYLLMISLIFIEPFTWAIRGQGFQYNSGVMRLFGSGLWAHPNSLGGVTVSNLPFFYFLLLFEKSKIKKILLIILMLIAISVIMFTSSRTALVGLVFFGFIIWFSSRKKFFGAALLIILFAVAWNIAPEETKNKLLTLKKYNQVFTEEGAHDSMDNRWLLIKNSFEIFKENPIIGVGIGNCINVSGVKYGIWLPTHNLYTQILSELGLLGGIIFFLVVYQTFKNLKSAHINVKESNQEKTLKGYVIKALTCFLIMRLFLGLFGDDLMENYWWIAGGLSIILLKLSKENTNMRPGEIDLSIRSKG